MKRIAKYIFIFLFLSGLFLFSGSVSAQDQNIALIGSPSLMYFQPGDVKITDTDKSQSFYDNLKGAPRYYIIDSASDFNLNLSILVPEIANKSGVYSAVVSSVQNDILTQVALADGGLSDWGEYYDATGRDYYLKGPEISQKLPAGNYKIEVFSKGLPDQAGDQGEYVLTIGSEKRPNFLQVLNLYWQEPLLKLTFFKTSVLEFFFTMQGVAVIGAVGVLLVFLALINYFVGLAREIKKHNNAKTLLLTSAGMRMKDEIMRLLQKPAYDITVAFITTAAKPQENTDYLKKDWDIMRDDLGFNVEEVDIDGKTEAQVLRLLELKDIIFVEGGNTFYLLKSMRACNFEKVIRRLLKDGKVYIGVSAGSIVAGRTILPSVWRGELRKMDKNIVGLKNFKGLNLVPFDIVVHYDRNPEIAELIKQKMPDPVKRAKNLRILTDDQAILVQGNEVDLIGKGDVIEI